MLPLTVLAGGDGTDATDTQPQSDGSTIYKTVGPDGRVVFTDTPPASGKAEKVQIGPVNVQPIARPRPLPVRKLSPRDQAEDDVDPGYAGPIDFAIVSPQNGATITAGQRFIELQVALDPVPPGGYEFYAVVDGQPWAGGSSGTSLDISALDRGTHTVQAVLVGAGGEVLAESQTIVLYVHRPGGTLPDNASPQATQAPKSPVAPGLPQAPTTQQQRQR